jgi:hypothetical protein
MPLFEKRSKLSGLSANRMRFFARYHFAAGLEKGGDEG